MAVVAVAVQVHTDIEININGLTLTLQSLLKIGKIWWSYDISIVPYEILLHPDFTSLCPAPSFLTNLVNLGFGNAFIKMLEMFLDVGVMNSFLLYMCISCFHLPFFYFCPTCIYLKANMPFSHVYFIFTLCFTCVCLKASTFPLSI